MAARAARQLRFDTASLKSERHDRDAEQRHEFGRRRKAALDATPRHLDGCLCISQASLGAAVGAFVRPSLSSDIRVAYPSAAHFRRGRAEIPAPLHPTSAGAVGRRNDT
jgi:hypothetical protein